MTASYCKDAFLVVGMASLSSTLMCSLLLLIFILTAFAVPVPAGDMPALRRFTFPGPPGFWRMLGSASTVVENSGLTSYSLTPGGSRGKFDQGSIWSNEQFALGEWEAVFTLSVSNPRSKGTDGMAFIISENLAPLGTWFGTNQDLLRGLAVVLDSHDNDGAKDNPSISLHQFDGRYRYDSSDDGLAGELGSCIADYRNRPSPIKLRVSYKAPRLSVYVDLRGNGVLQECVTAVVDLPAAKYYVGFSAQTLKIPDRHVVSSFRLSGFPYPAGSISEPSQISEPSTESSASAIVHEKLDFLMNSLNKQMEPRALGLALDEIERNFVRHINQKALPVRQQGYTLVQKMEQFERDLEALRTEQLVGLGRRLEETRVFLPGKSGRVLDDQTIQDTERKLKRIISVRLRRMFGRIGKDNSKFTDLSSQWSSLQWICIFVVFVELLVSARILFSTLYGRNHPKRLY